MRYRVPFTRPLGIVYGTAAFGVTLAAPDSPGEGVCPGGSTSMIMGPLSGRGLPLFLNAGARDRRNHPAQQKSGCEFKFNLHRYEPEPNTDLSRNLNHAKFGLKIF